MPERDKIIIGSVDPEFAFGLKSQIEESMVFHPAIVTGGRELIEMGQTRSVALILLDAFVDDLPGFEVCRRIREAGNSVPIVMFSQLKEEECSKAAGSWMADRCLVKGLPVPGLEKLVNDLIEEDTAGREEEKRGKERPAAGGTEAKGEQGFFELDEILPKDEILDGMGMELEKNAGEAGVEEKRSPEEGVAGNGSGGKGGSDDFFFSQPEEEKVEEEILNRIENIEQEPEEEEADSEEKAEEPEEISSSKEASSLDIANGPFEVSEQVGGEEEEAFPEELPTPEEAPPWEEPPEDVQPAFSSRGEAIIDDREFRIPTGENAVSLRLGITVFLVLTGLGFLFGFILARF